MVRGLKENICEIVYADIVSFKSVSGIIIGREQELSEPTFLLLFTIG